jgi:hypothetical protein
MQDPGHAFLKRMPISPQIHATSSHTKNLLTCTLKKKKKTHNLFDMQKTHESAHSQILPRDFNLHESANR